MAHAKHWTALRVSKTPKSKKKTVDNQSLKIANTTIISYDDFHGTQIEYRDPQGGAWLVYPNNRSVLPGRWKLDEDQRLCHKYFSSGINPATGVVGYEWECASKVSFQQKTTKYYWAIHSNYTDALDAFRQVISSAKFRLENSGSCSILNRTRWVLTTIRVGFKVVGPAGLEPATKAL